MKAAAVLSLALCIRAFAATGAFPQHMTAAELKHESYFRSIGVPFQRADGSYVTPTSAATVDRVLMQKDGSSYAIAFYRNDGGVLTLLAEPIVFSNALRSPLTTVIKVDGEDFSCTRVQVPGERVDMYVKRGRLVVVHAPDPNKSPDGTTRSVTPRAGARAAPLPAVGHH